jgi:hypothetical protein
MSKEKLFGILNEVANMEMNDAEKFIMSLDKSDASFVKMFCDIISNKCQDNLVNVD